MSTMTYRDTPIGFHRLYKAPLDNTERFSSNAELLEYCNSGSAYLGQRVVINYGNYDQEVILKGNNDKPIPVILNTPPNDFIYKIEGGTPYILVYYYNGGSAFTKGKDSAIRFDDPFAYSQLRFAELFANSMNIKFLLEVVSLSPDTSTLFTYTDDDNNAYTGYKNFFMNDPKKYNITQINPLDYTDSIVNSGDVEADVRHMGWTDNNRNAYILTENPSVVLMPKVADNERQARNIVRLWVDFTQYYKVWREGKD